MREGKVLHKIFYRIKKMLYFEIDALLFKYPRIQKQTHFAFTRIKPFPHIGIKIYNYCC
jgi:hypothetical protein